MKVYLIKDDKVFYRFTFRKIDPDIVECVIKHGAAACLPDEV